MSADEPAVTLSTEFPPMEELLDARVILRKQAKSGHPARKAKALRDLLVLERIITDAKQATAKVDPGPGAEDV